ncbi:MAG: hypothetical protein IJ688_08355 [Treponema sp.]|nr:hypothetical protein [Treponema sp.]
MFPKIYTEESIVAECQKMWPYFIRAEKFIAEHKNLIGCEFTLCNDGKIKSVNSRS